MRVWVAQHRERPEDVRVFRYLDYALRSYSESVASWRQASEGAWLGVDDPGTTVITLHLRPISEEPRR